MKNCFYSIANFAIECGQQMDELQEIVKTREKERVVGPDPMMCQDVSSWLTLSRKSDIIVSFHFLRIRRKYDQ
jgi:hypothetical protein